MVSRCLCVLVSVLIQLKHLGRVPHQKPCPTVTQPHSLRDTQSLRHLAHRPPGFFPCFAHTPAASFEPVMLVKPSPCAAGSIPIAIIRGCCSSICAIVTGR